MTRETNTKKRGRPCRSPEQQDLMKNAIIDTAKKLFVNRGFDSVSIRNISMEVNISPMTFYQVFKNKRALLYHIWDDIFAEVAYIETNIRETEKKPENQVKKIVQEVTRYWLEHPDHFKVIFMYQDKPSSDTGSYYADGSISTATKQGLHQTLKEGCKAGIFRQHETKAIVESIYMQILGVAMTYITIPEYSWEEIDTTINVIVDGILANLRK
tara:strand:+ start:474 stop:1112 length:639 start_codon:yes stop_codon:yes gene_type:complete